MVVLLLQLMLILLFYLVIMNMLFVSHLSLGKETLCLMIIGVKLALTVLILEDLKLRVI